MIFLQYEYQICLNLGSKGTLISLITNSAFNELFIQTVFNDPSLFLLLILDHHKEFILIVTLYLAFRFHHLADQFSTYT